MDSKKLARFLRAVLARDFNFEAPSHRTSSSVALFVAGLGAGVLVGMLFAPVSGEKLRSDLGDRAREGFEAAKSKTSRVVAQARRPGAQAGVSTVNEESAS